MMRVDDGRPPGRGSAVVCCTVAAAVGVLASPWGLPAVAVGAVGALVGAGLALAFRRAPRAASLAAPAAAPASSVDPGGLIVDGDTELARKVLAGGLQRPTDLGSPLVFIDHATDAASAEALERHLAGTAEATIVAHVRDPRLRRAIRDRTQAEGIGGRVLLFGVAATLARTVIGRERLYDQAYWRDQPRVHAIVVGSGALGRAAMAEAIFAGIAGDLAPPRVTILDPDPDRVRADLQAEMPELPLSAEIVVVDPSASFEAAVTTAEAASPLTVIVLCQADDAAQAEALLRLDRLQRIARRGLAPVLTLSEIRSPLAALACPSGRGRDLSRRFVVAAGWPGAVEAALVGAAEGDAAARRLHEAYRQAFGGTGASSAPWASLPESYRSANRRAADHLPQKLWTAGMTAAGTSSDSGAVVPEAHATIIVPCSRAAGEEAPMRRLARLEHDRWCAERRLDGWSYGSQRDDGRRRHPSLIPFDDPRLTDGEIAKDIDQIRFLFANVVRADPAGATAPLVIGVVGRSDHVAGIGVEGALALSAAASWRPVVVLTALVDPAERGTVDAIVSGLRAAGRVVRLLIVESQFGDEADRRIGAAAPPSWPEGLSDRCVATATIAAGDPAADGWTDPGADTDAAERVARYIGRRAVAVVTAADDRQGAPLNTDAVLAPGSGPASPIPPSS